MKSWQLAQKQSLPLRVKLIMTQRRIKEYYNYFRGNVAISFSGGKDSTVLLHIARLMYPDIKAVFIDTGLEYPEIRSFAKAQSNVEIIRPIKKFKSIIEEYGYPVISKESAQKIYEIRTTNSEQLMMIRLYGKGIKKAGKLPDKYHYLINAPFKISHRCCDFLKKKPSKIFEQKYKIITGEMATDSYLRRTTYLQKGCVSLENKIFCKPLSFWLESDIWDYIKEYSVEYSDIYKKGYSRTGCMFCMFGVHLEQEPNRFQRMKITHPKLYNYCMNNLGLAEVLKFIKVPYCT